jgi:hypothetical protein
MLNAYDWLRRCVSGAELIATLTAMKEDPDIFNLKDIGPPISGLERPCGRCWVYPCVDSSPLRYCQACLSVLARTKHLGKTSRNSVVAWAFLNHLPRGADSGEGFYGKKADGVYAHDSQHVMVVMDRCKIKDWLQELLMYHGSDLKGLIQIFPTCGQGKKNNMADVLCRAAYLDSRFPMDLLRVRFYTDAFQIFYPRGREETGLLTFEITEFMRWLERASMFRALLNPESQDMIWQLIKLKDGKEEKFYWGRFLGYLSPQAREMLYSWEIRRWSKDQIRFLYELLDYVVF